MAPLRFVSPRFRALLWAYVRGHVHELDRHADGWRSGSLLARVGLDSDLQFSLDTGGHRDPWDPLEPVPIARAFALCTQPGLPLWDPSDMPGGLGMHRDRLFALVGHVSF